MSETSIEKIFAELEPNEARLRKLESLPDPEIRFIIAITPRSGSSYLCDVMQMCKRLGSPGEFLQSAFIPKIAQSIPGRTPDEYMRNLFRVRRTPNDVAGLKASWFQFRMFHAALADRSVVRKFCYIYLIRKDSSEQAVSLYRATATQVFHTNIEHSAEKWNALTELQYDYDKIDHWHRHILAQERGWEAFFLRNRITPLTITYEDITHDIQFVLKRVAHHLGVNLPAQPVASDTSVFRKLGSRENLVWACRYRLENYDKTFEIEKSSESANAN